MQSQSFASRYLTMRREKIAHGWALAKRNKGCYLFLAPYAILFFTFYILPIATSIFYSFTYYNILEPARFIGLQNYVNLVLQDEVFLTSIKNTFVCAVIVGPIGYILSFLFAWFINELPKWLRAVAVIIFYAPSLGGGAYTVFNHLFRADDGAGHYQRAAALAAGSAVYAADCHHCQPVDEHGHRLPELCGRFAKH